LLGQLGDLGDLLALSLFEISPIDSATVIASRFRSSVDELLTAVFSRFS